MLFSSRVLTSFPKSTVVVHGWNDVFIGIAIRIFVAADSFVAILVLVLFHMLFILLQGYSV